MKEFLLNISQIDENKASLTESRSLIFKQELLLNMLNYHIVSGSEIDKGIIE